MVDHNLNGCSIFMIIGIVFEAYAPIGSPGRFFKQEGEPDVMEDPVIKDIAKKLNATPAQVYTSQQCCGSHTFCSTESIV